MNKGTIYIEKINKYRVKEWKTFEKYFCFNCNYLPSFNNKNIECLTYDCAIYCYQCSFKILEEGKCKKCLKDLENRALNEKIIEELKGLIIQCKSAKCIEEVLYQDLNLHYSRCFYRFRKCPECRKFIINGKYQKHTIKCSPENNIDKNLALNPFFSQLFLKEPINLNFFPNVLKNNVHELKMMSEIISLKKTCSVIVDSNVPSLLALEISEKISFLVLGCMNGKIIIFFSLLNGSFSKTKILSEHTSYVNDLKEYLKKSYEVLFLSASNDKTIRLWSTISDTSLKVITWKNEFVCICITHSFQDNTFISGDIKSGIIKWDLSQREVASECFEIETKILWITCLALIKNSNFPHKYIITGYMDGIIKAWDLTSSKVIKTFNENIKTVIKSLQHYKEEIFLSASDDCFIKLWNLLDGYCIASYKVSNDPLYCMTFFKEENIVLVSSRDKTLKVLCFQQDPNLNDNCPIIKSFLIANDFISQFIYIKNSNFKLITCNYGKPEVTLYS
jgi:hypothetical protein